MAPKDGLWKRCISRERTGLALISVGISCLPEQVLRSGAHASSLGDFERKQGKRKSRLQGLVVAVTAALMRVWSLGLGICIIAVSCAVLVFVASRLVVNSLQERKGTTPLLHCYIVTSALVQHLLPASISLSPGASSVSVSREARGDTHSPSPSLSEPGLCSY